MAWLECGGGNRNRLLFVREYGTALSGSITFEKSMKISLYIDTADSALNGFRFKINNIDATSIINNHISTNLNASAGFGYSYYKNIDVEKGDVLSWDVASGYYSFIVVEE